MKIKELITALHHMQVETGSLVCLGCGHEHACNIHGCAIIREATARLDELEKLQSYEPFVTDLPDDNLHTALNLFYAEDHNAFTRATGERMSLCDYIRKVVPVMKADIDLSGMTDSDVSEIMTDCLFYPWDSVEGIAAMIFTTGWAFAELRARLGEYEQIGKDVKANEESKD